MDGEIPDIAPIITLLKDSLRSGGAEGYVIGISGGIDSAVAASLCIHASDPSSVQGIFLPSEVTSSRDYEDVRALEQAFGLNILTVPIGPVIDAYRMMPKFSETPYLIGNLMARTRMAILYYYANRMNRLVCGTSNYTEFLLGYCTKYGDNAADVQPIIHLQKTQVWDLARFLNIPECIISKKPSAGLWEDQTDEEELGMRYEAIDRAISNLEEQGWSPQTPDETRVYEKIVKAGHKQRPAPHVKR